LTCPLLESQWNAASPPRFALAGEPPSVSHQTPPCQHRVSTLFTRARGRRQRATVDLN
jgi:hypothetical protein